ncbi:hypothetical protein J6590_082367 [Homalodisca vitripennis]|nr:hypothetical protein J6590_010373 [Homalodisca vitripennis]KAG8319873.1 hypothetical protein J6590_082367 [Homalodisca vitripennis]
MKRLRILRDFDNDKKERAEAIFDPHHLLPVFKKTAEPIKRNTSNTYTLFFNKILVFPRSNTFLKSVKDAKAFLVSFTKCYEINCVGGPNRNLHALLFNLSSVSSEAIGHGVCVMEEQEETRRGVAGDRMFQTASREKTHNRKQQYPPFPTPSLIPVKLKASTSVTSFARYMGHSMQRSCEG